MITRQQYPYAPKAKYPMLRLPSMEPKLGSILLKKIMNPVVRREYVRMLRSEESQGQKDHCTGHRRYGDQKGDAIQHVANTVV